MQRLPKIVRILAVISFTAVVVLFAALIVNSFQNSGKPLTSLAPEGPSAESIQKLVIPVTAIAGIVFVLVIGAIVFITWKFRERKDSDPDEFPSQIHGQTTLEIGWTILPALILAGIAVGTVMTIINLNREEPNSIKVQVAGQQWWWEYRYDLNGDGNFAGPEDITTATELVIPAGKPVQVTTTSNDVIHSFWIPGLNGKKDAVPGLYNPLKLQADEPGVFRGQCTEFCGLSHANMRMLVRAVSSSDYDAWVRNQLKDHAADPTNPVAAEGKKVWQALCAQCHVIKGINDVKMKETPPPLVAGVAPDLTHFMTRGTFAGSIFNLYEPVSSDGQPLPMSDVAAAGDPGAVLTGGQVNTATVNRVTLEAWLRNAPALKPMYPQGGRGMPNLNLTEEQIDQLVAFLETLN
ncbi:MAG: cytochrome c oxidase subunit II [Actinomycetia bacterium]|jgi:cytochrome c oxidase subunit 2|nr:cytochrome c oxidase subunit II [Actinomycetes bacterium]